MNKIALVTGATGFLGRHLIKRLKLDNWIVYISNRKNANLDTYENLFVFNDIKFTHIFHLAANTKAGDWCKYNKGEQWITNQVLNTNILKYWVEFQPQAKMISFGTSCSYSPSNSKLCESDYLIDQPDIDLYTYAMTKRMLYVGCKSLAEQYNLKYMHYVPSTLYGPNFDIEDSHFIFDLIKKIINGKYNGSLVELWGDGYQKRELVYIDDAIDIIMNTIHLNNEILNIAHGTDYTIRQFAEMICKHVKFMPDLIKYDTTKFTGVRRKLLSIDKLLSFLPEKFKFTDIKFGLFQTINYININKDNNYENNSKK
jgi:GDP-L-fucose synthase